MPKPVDLTPDDLDPASTRTPVGVMSPRGTASSKGVTSDRKITEPFQLRLPPEKRIAIKVDASQRDMSHSDFMLACYDICKERDLLPSGKGITVRSRGTENGKVD